MKITICILIIFLLTSCNKKEIEINSLGQLLDKHFDAVGIHNLDNCKSLLIREMMVDYEDSFAYNIIEIKMKKPDKYS